MSKLLAGEHLPPQELSADVPFDDLCETTIGIEDEFVAAGWNLFALETAAHGSSLESITVPLSHQRSSSGEKGDAFIFGCNVEGRDSGLEHGNTPLGYLLAGST
ncbi:MAG: hypothetical protein GY713_05415 [Actinomycetia bacterium]|nr:hypothetical protein [Actinomycetes bacterium]